MVSFTKTKLCFRTGNKRICMHKVSHSPNKTHRHSPHIVQITHLWSKVTNQFYIICWPSLSLQRRIPPPPLSWHLLAGSSAWLTGTWWPFPAQCPLPAESERRGPREYLDNESTVDEIISMRAEIYKTMGTQPQSVNLWWSTTQQAHRSVIWGVKSWWFTLWCMNVVSNSHRYLYIISKQTFIRRKKSNSETSIWEEEEDIRFSGRKQHLPLASILKIEISAAFTWLNSAVSSESTNNYRSFRHHK